MTSKLCLSKEGNGRMYEVWEQHPTDDEGDVYYDLIVFDIEMRDGVPHLFENYCGEPHHEYDMDFFTEWIDEAITMDAQEEEVRP